MAWETNVRLTFASGAGLSNDPFGYAANGLIISGGTAQGGNGDYESMHSDTFGASTGFEIGATLVVLPATGGYVIVEAIASTASNGNVYDILYIPGTALYARKSVAGTYTNLITGTPTLVAGDKVGLRKSGSTLTLSYWHAGTWTVVGTATDSTYNGPFNPGAYLWSNSGTNTQIDDMFYGTVLAAPTHNAPTAGNAQVTINWSAVSGASGYTIQYGTSTGVYTTSVNAGNVTSYNVTGLTNGTTYYFKVQAYDSANTHSDLSATERSASPTSGGGSPPSAPTQSDPVAGNTQITVSWGAVAGASGYKVKRGTASGSFTTTTDVGNTLSYAITGLVNNTQYYMVIVAYNANGDSSNSNEKSATPFAPSSGTTLRQSTANTRYMSVNGVTTVLAGQHTWHTIQDSTELPIYYPLDFTGYLDSMVNYGHNFLRLWAWEHTGPNGWTPSGSIVTPTIYQRTGPGNAIDGGLKYDLTKLNQAYFDRLRQRVLEATGRGLTVSVMLFQGWSVGVDDNPSAWPGHPYHASNNINSVNGDTNADGVGTEIHKSSGTLLTTYQQAYVRKVIDTLNDIDNMMYELVNEAADDSAVKTWQQNMADYIASYEAGKPKQHVCWGTALYAGDNAWLTGANANIPAISPQGYYTTTYKENNVPAVTAPGKTWILDTDHIWGIGGSLIWVWQSFLRGYNVAFMDSIAETADNRNFSESAEATSMRWAMGDMIRYSKRMNMDAVVPASSGYMLSGDGKYLRLFNGASSFTPSNGTYKVEWFDILTRQTYTDADVTVTGSTTFTPPVSGDVVLFLEPTTPPATGSITRRGNVVVANGATGGGTGSVPSVVATNHAESWATSLTINKPGAALTGHLLVANLASPQVITPPAGWTQIGSTQTVTIDFSGGSYSLRVQAYYKFVAAGEPSSYTFTIPAQDDLVGDLVVVSGVDPTTPINDADWNQISTASASIVSGNNTTTADNCLLLFLSGTAGDSDGGDTTTAPSGFTTLSNSVTALGLWTKTYAASGAQATAGATGAKTATQSTTSQGAALLLAIKPSASGGNTVVTASKPTGVVLNDGLIAALSVVGTGVPTAPSGWTLQRQASTTTGSLYVYTKMAGSNEPATYTWSLSNSDAATVAIYACYNLDPAGVFVSQIQANETASTSMTAPSVIPSTADDMLVFLGTALNPSILASAPSGMSEQADSGMAYVAELLLTSGNATGSKSATLSSSAKSIAAMVAVKAPGNAVPAAPVLTSANPNNGSISVAWSASPLATGYTVKWGTSVGTYGNSQAVGNATGYTIPGLTNGTRYYIVVVATNATGTSANSNELSAIPTLGAPGSPTLSSATPGVGQVSLAWTAAQNATGYRIKYGTSSGNYLTTIDVGNVLSYSVTGLTNGVQYFFVVVSYNTSGTSANSNELNGTPNVSSPPPAAPVFLQANPGNNSVSLLWDAVPGATGYKIKRGPSGVYGTTTDVGNVTSYNYTGLSNGTRYYFVVVAYNANGDSVNSNELSATPSASSHITTKYNNLFLNDVLWFEKMFSIESMQVQVHETPDAGKIYKTVAVDGKDAYEYRVTRNNDGTGKNDWLAGDSLVNTGGPGNGYIDQYAYNSTVTRPLEFILLSTTVVIDPFSDNFELFSGNNNMYFGVGNVRWDSIHFSIGQAAVYTSATFVYEYWNGTAWVALPGNTFAYDANGQPVAANFKTAGGSQGYFFNPPSDWALATIGPNNSSAYWIRIRLTGVAGWTSGPTQARWWITRGKQQYGPTIVGWRRKSSVWNDISEAWAVGNLRGLYSYGNDIYGFAAGDPNGAWIGLDANNGLRMMSGPSTIKGQIFPNGTWKFTGNANQFIQWDGTQLVVAGTINIIGGSGYANLTDKPTSLSGINAGEGTKLTGIQPGATVGATWGVNLGSIPVRLSDAPTGAGLYLAADKMGFYGGTNWRTYMDNAGNFLFRNAPSLSANVGVVQWNGQYLSGGYYAPANVGGLAAYGALTVQWYTDAVTGAIVAAGGSTYIDKDGVWVRAATGETGNFDDSSAIHVGVGRIAGWQTGFPAASFVGIAAESSGYARVGSRKNGSWNTYIEVGGSEQGTLNQDRYFSLVYGGVEFIGMSGNVSAVRMKKGVEIGTVTNHPGVGEQRIAAFSSGWLNFTQYVGTFPNTASPMQFFSAAIPNSVILKSWQQPVYVYSNNSGNTASHYWTIYLKRLDTGGTIDSFTTIGMTAATWATVARTLSTALGTSNIGLFIEAIKTGTPGDLYLAGPMVWFE